MKKTFDCIKMKHDLQEQIYNEIKPSSDRDFLNKLIERSNKSQFCIQLTKNSKLT